MGIPLVALMGRPPQIRDWGEQQLLNNQNQNIAGQNALQPGQLAGQQNELESQRLQIQQQKQQLADQKAMTDAMHEWDGKDYGSLPGLVLKNGGSAQTVMGLKTALIKQQSDLLGMNERQQAIEKLKNDHFSQAIDNVASLPEAQQPAAFEAAKADSVQKGWLDPQEAQGMQYQNPQQLQFLKKTLQGHAAALDEATKQATIAKEQAAGAESAAKLPGETAESTIKQQDALLTPQERAGLKAPGTLEDRRYEQIVAAQSQGQKVSADDLAWKKGYEKRKTLVPVAQVNLQQSLLTPQAKQALGENFAQTGNLPAGLRSPAMSAQILNEAAKGGDLNIAANKATYTADAGSLKKLQTQFDTVNAFENTAIKNLDQVAKAGAKVPDLGARYANIPVRMISSQMIGTPEMAAFKTALLTAQNEAAKVLTSANASGVLSDSARHEAQQVLDGNLPFPAMMASINQLKTDFANRHQAYQGQISDIKSRIAKPGAPSTGAGGLMYARDPQGKLHSAPAGTALPTGWKAEQAP